MVKDEKEQLAEAQEDQKIQHIQATAPGVEASKEHHHNPLEKIKQVLHIGKQSHEPHVTTTVETSEKMLEQALAKEHEPDKDPDTPRAGHETDTVNIVHPSLQAPTHAQHTTVKKVLMLFNPHSGSQKGEKIAKEAKQLFLAAKVDVHDITLERRGHGEELCKTLDISKYDVLCFIGGDGTFHECVNGLLKRTDGQGSLVPIAMIAGGTGNSMSLELLGDTDVKLAVDTITRGIHAPVDVGKIVQLDVKKVEGIVGSEVIYSFNSIHWGLASKVNMTAEKLRWMGKAVRYTTAALMEMMNGDSSTAAISFEDDQGKVVEYKEKFCLAIANNIVTAAKGMKMAPKAKLNDGLIDLILIRSHKTFDLMKIFSKVYDGSHTDLEYVEYKQVKWFSIVPYTNENQVVLDEECAEEVVDIDGELKGATPFRCEVMRNAIRVIV